MFIFFIIMVIISIFLSGILFRNLPIKVKDFLEKHPTFSGIFLMCLSLFISLFAFIGITIYVFYCIAKFLFLFRNISIPQKVVSKKK